jgi:hypothetical protein
MPNPISGIRLDELISERACQPVVEEKLFTLLKGKKVRRHQRELSRN